MISKKIFIILGHPDTETFTGMLAGEYKNSALAGGHQVRRMNIGELSFDPILHKGYKEIQELEPDLKEIQKNIQWADHVVILYPNWWNTMPALLKGMFDRMWIPGFAFNFDKKTKSVIQRLKGKSARVIVVAGTNNSFMTWLKFGDCTNEIKRGILEFSGLGPVKVTTFGPCNKEDRGVRERWKREVKELGRRGC